MNQYLIVIFLGFAGYDASDLNADFGIQYAGRVAGPNYEHPLKSWCHFKVKGREVGYDEAHGQVRKWMREGRPVYVKRSQGSGRIVGVDPPDKFLWFDFDDVSEKQHEIGAKIRAIDEKIGELERERKRLEDELK